MRRMGVDPDADDGPSFEILNGGSEAKVLGIPIRVKEVNSSRLVLAGREQRLAALRIAGFADLVGQEYQIVLVRDGNKVKLEKGGVVQEQAWYEKR